MSYDSFWNMQPSRYGLEMTEFASLGDFLAWEGEQDGRYELLKGRANPVSVDTVRRNTIRGNIFATLRKAHLSNRCHVFSWGLPLITPSGDMLLPDVFGACGKIDWEARQLRDANIIFEIATADGNEETLNRRIEAYRSLPSIRHIAVVLQDEHAVDMSNRTNSGWVRNRLRGDSAMIPLSAVGVTLGMADVFDDIEN
jgi:hypothetical protein